ncbi:heavy metal translocating P-type ATPase [Cellulosimicrobium cellulans]|uniref:heavy metal translocating P-type ATPase n=1 Tax=Cellulosimicrobium cellulans TaxID=1710 RepID=UPI003815CFD6
MNAPGGFTARGAGPRLRAWARGRWAVPAAAGTLVLASFAASALAGHGWWSDALMVSAAVVAGAPVAVAAWRALTARSIGIDLLVAVAAVGAILVRNFWEAAAVTFLFAVGHALESATLDRTRAALAELVAVLPDAAVVLRDGRQVEVTAADVAAGETVLVKNGAKVPVDGTILRGVGAVDESSVTGESIPAEKVAGDAMFAGTIVTAGLLQVTATGVGEDTTLARIIHRVEEAQDARARAQGFMERFSAWYTPAVIVLAVAVGVLTRDVLLALTLLVVACPGALVISIPVSVVAGIGRAARDGVLVKGGEFLETVARVDAVALDKTGTLTEGRPRLTDVVVLDPAADEDDVLLTAARVEAGSEHPLARAVVDAAAESGHVVVGLPEHTEPVLGRGVLAVLDGVPVAVGNLALLAGRDVVGAGRAAAVMAERAAAGRTPMVVTRGDAVLGVVAVADQVRPDAASMVSRLRAVGVRRIVVLTGDVDPVARAVAAETGVDEVGSGLLPEEKLAAVRDLQREGYTVAMVGDGVNDAPALAAADVGVAMGAAGTRVAIETADVALLGDDLLKVPHAVSLARRTVRTMRQNIVIALVTVVALLTGILVGGVTMAVGMLVHEASVLVVVVNAMRLARRPRSAAAVPGGQDRAARSMRTSASRTTISPPAR